MIVRCENCLIDFDKKYGEMKKTKHNFCSHSCSAKFSNKHRKRIKIDYGKAICQNPECKKEFSCRSNSLNKFCSTTCSSRKSSLDSIDRFEKGLLKDGSVRRNTIRKYLYS